MLPEIIFPFLFVILGMVMGIPVIRYCNRILKKEMDEVCFLCKAPVLSVLCGGVYLLVFLNKGLDVETVIGCLLGSVLLALSLIDLCSYEIPVRCNIFIGFLGVVRVIFNWDMLLESVVGMVVISGLLLVLYMISKGKAIGGGDIKLMAAAGFLLGVKGIVFAFIVGCIGVTFIHPLRMKLKGENSQLAFGPYLSAGIMAAYLWGDKLIHLYLTWCGL